MAEGFFRSKIAKGLIGLGLLGGAEQVGSHLGHEDGQKSGYEAGQKAGQEKGKKSAIEERAAQDAAEKKKKEDEANNFGANQDKLLKEYRKLEIDSFEAEKTPKDVVEMSNKLARAKALDAFKNYSIWLRANSDDELFKSVSLLKNLVESKYNDGTSGITIKEVQALMVKDPELKSRIEHVFEAFSGLRDDVKNGKIELTTTKIDTGKKVGNTDVTSMNYSLEMIAQLLKSEETEKAN